MSKLTLRMDVLVYGVCPEVGWAIWNADGAFGFIDSGRADVDYEVFEGHKLDRKRLGLLRRHAAGGEGMQP